MDKRKLKIALSLAVLIPCVLYAAGIIAQFIININAWKAAGSDYRTSPGLPSSQISEVVRALFHFPAGLIAIGVVVLGIAVLCVFGLRIGWGQNGVTDSDRNLTVSNSGSYGTASFMSPKEASACFEVTSAKRTSQDILGMLPDTQTEKGLSDMMASISHEHANQYTGELLPPSPASAPYAIFRQSSETVRTSVIIGLGSKLAVLQAQQVRNITSYNEIDLELPGKQKCACIVLVSMIRSYPILSIIVADKLLLADINAEQMHSIANELNLVSVTGWHSVFLADDSMIYMYRQCLWLSMSLTYEDLLTMLKECISEYKRGKGRLTTGEYPTDPVA